jgi:hypothetical protein
VDKRNAAAGIFPPGSLSISWRLTKFQQLFLPTRSACWTLPIALRVDDASVLSL